MKKKEKDKELEQLRELSKNWTAQDWENHLLTLEGGEENTPCSAGPFENLLRKTPERDFDSENQNQYPRAFKLAARKAIRDLPETSRQVIEKIFYDGMSEQQVAELIGISQQAVNLRKNRAILQIQNNPLIQLVKPPIVWGNTRKKPRCQFERIDDAFERGKITKDEKYKLWAAFEVGPLRRFV